MGVSSLRRRSAGVEVGPGCKEQPNEAASSAADRSQPPVPRCHVCSFVWTASRLRLQSSALCTCACTRIRIRPRAIRTTAGSSFNNNPWTAHRIASHRIVEPKILSGHDWICKIDSKLRSRTSKRSLGSSQSCQQPLPSFQSDCKTRVNWAGLHWSASGSAGLSFAGLGSRDALLTPLESLSLRHARVTASEARHPRCFAQLGTAGRTAIQFSFMDSAPWHGSVGRNSTLREAVLVHMRPL